MILSLTACGSSASSTAASTAAATGSDSAAASTASDSATPAATKQYVIGIAEAQANDEVTTRRAYLEDFIAPTYNVKFIFSETLRTTQPPRPLLKTASTPAQTPSSI